ncbi:MAG TPA: formyltransferase family protein [Blastocatellia bacterium]|nr:formyltransferase family protein [Blastocatellia bacterium]
MRILFLGNNWVGWQIASLLRERGEEVVGVVLHPEDRRRFGDEIKHAAGCSAEYIFDGSQLSNQPTIERIQRLAPEIGVSAMFGYIVRRQLLEIFSAGCINVHTSLLPYNRGAYPNVWSIVDGTPAGVTIHYMDEGVDTGDIIAQREVPVSDCDTGASLQRKLELACVELFADNWDPIKAGRSARMPQAGGLGSSHRVRDVDAIDTIDLDRHYSARELINILRARTFPPHPGAYFLNNGRRVYVRVDLIPEGKLDGG